MQFRNIIALLALGAAASAYDDSFHVPEGQKEGVYSVYRAEDGSEVHTPVDSSVFSAKFAARSSPNISPLMKKDQIPAGSASCGSSHGLDNADTDAANADLDRQCGGWTTVKAGLHFYSIRGKTVAFFCNFNTEADYGCSNGARVQYSREVTAACGAYNAGWVTVTGQDSGDPNYSYGYDLASNGFCGCGTSC